MTVPSPTATPTSAAPAPPPSLPAPRDAASVPVTAPAMALPVPTSQPTGVAPPLPAVGAKRKASDAPPALKAAAPRGRSFLNHQQRLEILKKKEEEPKWTQVQLARWAAVHFGLPKEPSQATIAVLLKKREQLKAATVRPQTRTIRSPRHPELEAALLLWVRHLQSQRVAFTGENIRLKAAELAAKMDLATSLNFSTGWMSGFVTRHNLMLARAHKKKQSDSDDEPARAVLKGYEPRNVFALHETALLYKDLPYDQDEDRDRICVGLAANADASEKLEPLVVTTCRRKKISLETFFNPDGRMTARIFEQWLYKLNQRMVASHRKIAVVVAAAPSHFPLQLSHVRLVVLPALTGTHPLDASVTKSFKALYRRTHLSFAVDQAEEARERVFDVSLARALVWVKQAWLDVAPELIRAGWARSGLLAREAPPAEVVDIHPEVVQSLVVSLSQLQMLEAMPLESLVSAASELGGVHYEYDDATVMRVVAGDVDDQHSEDADGDDEQLELAARLKMAGDAERAFYHDTHVFDREPSPDELLANYRGVIWSLDADPERSADHQAALRLLRRKQAALRLQQQQTPPPETHDPAPTSVETTEETAPATHPPADAPPVVESLVL